MICALLRIFKRSRRDRKESANRHYDESAVGSDTGCATFFSAPADAGKGEATTGFTLIELLLVISLISLMLFLAVPQFQAGAFTDSSRRSTILLKQTIEALKRRSVEKQVDCVLKMNLDTHRYWITDETMDEEEQIQARQSATDLSEVLFIEEVAFSDEDTRGSGEVDLYVYRQGYSDRAGIHLRQTDGRRMTLRVEPFLPQIRIETDDDAFR